MSDDGLQRAYERVYHLMVQLQADRDWWRRAATIEGVLLLGWLIFLVVEAW